MTTINPDVFWSVLAALVVYGVGKHVLGVALSQLLGKQPVAATPLQTRSGGTQKESAT